MKSKAEAIETCLAGMMVGDSIGLPYEGMSPKRIARHLSHHTLRQSLLPASGMVSDDTEHAIITVIALIRCNNRDNKYFAKHLAWGLRWWLLRLPAGIGMATGRAIIKLCCGFPASHSGVYSAGNGPGMRAPVLGVIYGDHPNLLLEKVTTATRITHTHPEALVGALAIAQASYLSSTGQSSNAMKFKLQLHDLLKDIDESATQRLMQLLDSIDAASNLEELILHLKLEKGVTGYINHTLPIVLYLWFKYPEDYRTAVTEVIRCGGDTDTTAAILGGILGAGLTSKELPQEWLSGVRDWPVSLPRIQQLALAAQDTIEKTQDRKTIPLAFSMGPLVFLRNMFFLVVVLIHGFKRLLPPW